MEMLEVVTNYQKAVSVGAYDRHDGGLFGKLDNVRRYWEDQVTRNTLREFLAPFVAQRRRAGKKLRVLDLGCGAGEGYEIFSSLSDDNYPDSAPEQQTPDTGIIDFYRGLDLSPCMVEKAVSNYKGLDHVAFDIADLCHGLPRSEEAYDVYFSSYGSLSHLPDEDLRRVIHDICDRVETNAIFVADLVGRYSYEWPDYWIQNSLSDPMRPYSMSYIYPPGVREEMIIEVFPLRFWGGDEIGAFVECAAAERGVTVTRRLYRDRSVLVGRHLDTAEFNPSAPPIRAAVNSLLEFNRRTQLEDLLFNYRTQPGPTRINNFFQSFTWSWNALVGSCIDGLRRLEKGERPRIVIPDDCDLAVPDAIRTLGRVMESAHLFQMGDPVANVIERQLAWLLMGLEESAQRGLGASHGLLANFELRRVNQDEGDISQARGSGIGAEPHFPLSRRRDGDSLMGDRE
ncbi:MAG TPA: class I SAM-dependent methyltransferase [Armatimonadota bacterium]|nr:class I SAM-dependent methyltransferase [Armatimonadota bacterium]